tara:strand:+ start:357 stop:1076 length:720 start_codon:yes stop_codon:yes gene_type:complete
MDFNIYISTSDNHLHLLKPYTYLFNKFWHPGQKVTIVGYKAPDFKLPDNFTFESMGQSTHDPREWAGDLGGYFSSKDDKHFIFGVEDHFISYPVDTNMIDKLAKYTLDDKVGRINLTFHLRQRPYDIIEMDGDLEVIEAHTTNDYRISTQYSIWNREYMLKYLQHGLDIWNFEMVQSQPAKTDGYRVLGTGKMNPIHVATGVRKLDLSDVDWTCDEALGDPSKHLKPEVIQDMKDKGII